MKLTSQIVWVIIETDSTNGSVDNINITHYDVLWCVNKRKLMEEFDKWLEELIDKNGTTNY